MNWQDVASLLGKDIANADMHSDSRQANAADIFVAIPGEVYDGRKYIEQALTNGVVAVLAHSDATMPDRIAKIQSTVADIPVLWIPELRQNIAELASTYYGRPSHSLTVVGVTGTNGKTTVSWMVRQLLTMLGKCCGQIGTLGYGLSDQLTAQDRTTPDSVTIQRILASFVNQNAEAVVMEVSSHALSQGRVDEVEIDVGVFTNLSRDHLDYHASMDEYAAAKAQLFARKHIKSAVINLDDDYAGMMINALSPDVLRSQRLIGVSLTGSGWQDVAGLADERKVLEAPILRLDKVIFNASGFSAELIGWGEPIALQAPLFGHFNAYNLLAAVAVCYTLDLEHDRCADAILGMSAVPGRMEMYQADGQPTCVIDFAHTPSALESVLQTLRPHTSGSLWVVFGCGGDRDKGKRALMGSVAEKLADKIVLTLDNPRSELPQVIMDDILSGISLPQRVDIHIDRAAAIRHTYDCASHGDVILIAGKGHETYQEIDGIYHHYSDQEVVRHIIGGKS